MSANYGPWSRANRRPYVFIAVVMKRGALTPMRWRTAPSLKQALFLARRNRKAGRLTWVERKGQEATHV